MTKIQKLILPLIRRNLDGKKVLLLFVVTNLLYAVMLTVTIPKVMNLAGEMKIMDMLPAGYNPEYVNSLLKALGEKGRNVYLYEQIPLDMVYPFLFALSWCIVLGYILDKLGKLDSKLIFLCLIPVFAGAFDYCENIGIITILKRYPANSALLSQITSVFTVLKSTCTTIFFIILVTFIIVLGIKKLKGLLIPG